MKSVLYIVALFSLALVACTERLPESNMPDNVENGAITMVTASVKPLYVEGLDGVGNYKWGESVLGIVSSGKNERYLPVKSTTGDNEAYFYGNEVGGEMAIYMPYSNENGAKAVAGRLTMLTEQNYYADPFDHLMYNSTFLATTTDSSVEFDYYAGLAKIVLKHDISDIVSVTVRVGNVSEGNYDNYLSGDYSIVDAALDDEANRQNEVIVKIDTDEPFNSTVDNPAHVWAALTPGTYEHLIVVITPRVGEPVLLPVEGMKKVGEEVVGGVVKDITEPEPFVIKRCALAKDVVAEQIDRNNGVDPFEPEENFPFN